MLKYVKSNEVKLGDVIIGYRNTKPNGGTGHVTRTRIQEFVVSTDYSYSHINITSGKLSIPADSTTDFHEWLVDYTRPEQYPHKCPQCGEQAYIGLTRVEHRYPQEKCHAK